MKPVELLFLPTDTLPSSGPHTFNYPGEVTVTASSFETGTPHTPQKSIDNNLSTRWSSEGDGEWILYDLNSLKNVSSVAIAFYQGESRKSFFSIELSTDGTNFEEVYRGQSSGKTVETENYSFEPRATRFVRIIGKGNSKNQWNSITEVLITTNNTARSVQPRALLKLVQALHVQRIGTSKYLIHYHLQPSVPATITIIDLQGKLLYSRPVVFINNHALLSDVTLAAGLYYLTVEEFGRSDLKTKKAWINNPGCITILLREL